MLQVTNLTKSIQNRPILSNLTFELKRSEIAIFLGPSGVGKSTLLRVLNGLDGHDSGTILLDDSPLKSVGMVFQHFNLFEHLTVEENITLALIKVKKIPKAEAHSIAEGLLLRYGLDDKAKASVKQLSGGQKQRLSIARTVAMRPEVICFDEPTSALDPRLTSQVAQYITEIASDNHIVCLTTHDMSLLEQLEAKLYLMQSGHVVESSTTHAFRNSPKSYPLLHSFLVRH